MSDTLQCLEMGAVETLIVWENLEARARPPAALPLGLEARDASVTDIVTLDVLARRSVRRPRRACL